jgi:hypothetical protein
VASDERRANVGGAYIGLYVCAAGVADINSDVGATHDSPGILLRSYGPSSKPLV